MSESKSILDMGHVVPPQSPRNSNFELLRIVAMLMIITYHVVAVAFVNNQLKSESYIAALDVNCFCDAKFYPQLLLVQLLMPFGAVGNAIFILISGYFMVSKRTSVNLAKSGIKLFSQLLFGVLLITCASAAYFHFFKEDYVYLYGINFLNSGLWFLGYYFVIIVFGKVFLNDHLQKLDKKQWTAFLIVLFCLFSFTFTGTLLEKLVEAESHGGLRTLVCGVFLYSLGGFIKEHNPFSRVRATVFISLIIFVFAFWLLAYHNSVVTSIEQYNQGAQSKAFVQSLDEGGNYSFYALLIATGIFELFSRLRLPHLKVINLAGAATLMIYIIHANNAWYSLAGIIDWVTMFYVEPWWVSLGWIIGVTLLTFAVGVAFYACYLGVSKLVKTNLHILLKER